MKHMNKFLLFLLLPVIFGLTACSKDEDTPTTPQAQVNESEVLVKYLEANGDYLHAGSSFVMSAADFKTAYVANPAKIYTIDLRSAADFATKHLIGAHNVAMADLLTHIKGLTLDSYDKVVVTCYSGQTAAYAISLVRATLPLAQGNKIVSLKWGMSSIDSTFATNYWLAKRSNARAAQFVTTDAPAKPAAGTLPTLSTGKTEGKDILESRVNTLLAAGYTVGVSEATLYTNLSNYFIINYWPVALYKAPGHVDGSYNYDPTAKPFQLANDLKTLPKDKQILLYCYTGQTSSYVSAYLRLLGYDARSLTYGANSMIWDLMKSNSVASTFIPENEIKGYKDLLQ